MTVPACFFIIGLFALVALRIPGRLLMQRLATPLVVAAILLVTQAVFFGNTPLLQITFAGASVTFHVEGVMRGLVIVCRVLSGVSLVLFLSMSTSADKLFRAATWFRVPPTLIEIAILMYRYIFVLSDEMIMMQAAQRIRLGYRSWIVTIRSLSSLGACIILRAYDRAERVFEAMSVRGYAGIRVDQGLEFCRRDGWTAALLGLILAGLYLIGQVAI
jgi:cobalt/nickel transport system permease protein